MQIQIALQQRLAPLMFLSLMCYEWNGNAIRHKLSILRNLCRWFASTDSGPILSGVAYVYCPILLAIVVAIYVDWLNRRESTKLRIIRCAIASAVVVAASIMISGIELCEQLRLGTEPPGYYWDWWDGWPIFAGVVLGEAVCGALIGAIYAWVMSDSAAPS